MSKFREAVPVFCVLTFDHIAKFHENQRKKLQE